MKSNDDEGIYNSKRIVKSEFVGLEMANSYIRPMTIEGNPRKFLEIALQDTNYEVGYVSPTLEDIVGTIEIKEVTSVYKVIQDSIEIFEQCEYEFDVEVVDSIEGKYKLLVNCYADGERGNKTYKRFDYDFNTDGTSRSGDATEFCSGLIPVGANGIGIKDTEWIKAKGFPCDKPLGQDFIVDEEAHAMFSNGDKYILGTHKTEDTNGNDLMISAWNKLQEIKKIKFDYEVPVVLTDDEFNEIDTGDTVYVTNDKFIPPIQLEARIDELHIKEKGSYVKLSNYKEVKSKIKSLDKNDIIKDVIDAITGLGVGKLTEAEKTIIIEYLKQLGLEQEEINKIIEYIVELEKPDIPQLPGDIPEDSEDYDKIYLTTTKNGLWIGDDRVYDIKKYASAEVPTEPTDPVDPPSDNGSSGGVGDPQEYKEAVEYYSKFWLGKNKDNSIVDKVMSKNNSYKYYAIVPYWCKKFGLDPQLIYAMMIAESSGNPYADAAAYGCMQCEKAAYFGYKQTIKFLDGTTQSFTPSYSTMKPGGEVVLNGVTVDKGISNQVMFGCNEFKVNMERFSNNIFAALAGYNFGPGGPYWCICKYVAEKYGYTFVNKRSLSAQSNAVKEKYYEELDGMKCNWSAYRKQYKDYWKEGTATNIEYYLKWYKPINGQLPYILDKSGKKIGYGANLPNSVRTATMSFTTPYTTSYAIRQKIVDKAIEITKLHQEKKIATYDQGNRIVNDDKRFKANGTIRGIKNPYCYDCSSLVSCAYLCAGLKSVYNKSCATGTLITSAISKPGYKVWKCTNDNLDNHAIAGDIIMVSNTTVPSVVDISKYKGSGKTHHTLIYCGKKNGTHYIAHARKWDYHPNAIKYSPVYSDLLKFGIILRPWDLVEAEKGSDYNPPITPDPDPDLDNPTPGEPIVPGPTILDIVIKGAPGAIVYDYISDEKLVENIEVNGVIDNTKYPATVPYIFIHFGISDLGDTGITGMKNLLTALRNKYKNTPIFVAKELKVNDKYPNYIEINNKIDEYNNAILAFANEEEYIIQLDISNGLVVNGLIDTTLTDNGFSFKDKASVDKYYDVVKKAILAKAIGGTLKPPTDGDTNPPTEEKPIIGGKEDILLKNSKIHKYEVMDEMSFHLPSKVISNFWTKLIFKTNKNTEPIKYSQSSLVYLEGSHCKKGVLVSQADTTYNISIIPSAPNDLKETYVFKGAIAHRGAKGLRPENTLLAFENAVNIGYLGSECDVRVTKDGYLILIHDETVDKMTNGTGKVSNLTLAQIKALTIDYGTGIINYPNLKIPTLEEYLDFCISKKHKCYIDLKGLSNEDIGKLISTIKAKNYISSSCIVTTYNNGSYIRTLDKNIGLCIGDRFTTSNINKISKLGGDVGINVNQTYKDVTTSMVKYAHSKKIKVYVWTVDTQSDFDNYIKQGVDYIITNKLQKYEDKTHKKYYGTVSASSNDGNFKDFTDFVGGKKVAEIAKTYLDNKDKFKYNTKTPLDYTNPQANINSWKTDGLFHIDCSCLIGLIFRGLTFKNSPYGKSISKITKNTAYSWAIDFGRTAAKQAELCVKNGWVMNEIDMEEFSNLEEGDLLFYDDDNINNERFMNISHVGICVGKDANGVTQMIEGDAESTSSAIRLVNIKDNITDRLLFVARVRKD